eukprot:COSAG02_NODE_1515_length_12187_cov_37.042025_7_plen_77_part_00
MQSCCASESGHMRARLWRARNKKALANHQQHGHGRQDQDERYVRKKISALIRSVPVAKMIEADGKLSQHAKLRSVC